MTDTKTVEPLRLVVDVHGDDMLNMNQPKNRYVQAQYVKRLRQLGWAVARSQPRKITHAVAIRATIAPPVETFFHKRDSPNYMPTLKALLDGIVDAGVLIDDSDKYVPLFCIEPSRAPYSRPGWWRITFTIGDGRDIWT